LFAPQLLAVSRWSGEVDCDRLGIAQPASRVKRIGVGGTSADISTWRSYCFILAAQGSALQLRAQTKHPFPAE
jgi:hypothetical protein